MMPITSPSSSLPQRKSIKSHDQSFYLSPQRKKARRVSDPLDSVVRNQPDNTTQPPRCNRLLSNQANPLSLLCFALESELARKENVAPKEMCIDPESNNAATPKTTASRPRKPDVVPSSIAAHENATSDSPENTSPPSLCVLNESVSPTAVLSLDRALETVDQSSKVKRNYQPWHVRFKELLAFKAIHGNCRVPQKSVTYPSLARWVVYMRAQYKAGKLTKDKISKLEEAGFEWCADNSRATEWNEKFKELERFERAHGHLNVLQHQNPALHYWCYMQRCKRTTLPLEQLIKLDKLGFDWGIYFDPTLQPVPTGGTFDTDRLLVELQIFFRTHGHVNVPNRFPPSPALAQWVRKVSTNDLDQKQVALMNSLGFVWRNEGADRCEAGTMTNFNFLRERQVSHT